MRLSYAPKTLVRKGIGKVATRRRNLDTFDDACIHSRVHNLRFARRFGTFRRWQDGGVSA
jgi:hypothetical protein